MSSKDHRLVLDLHLALTQLKSLKEDLSPSSHPITRLVLRGSWPPFFRARRVSAHELLEIINEIANVPAFRHLRQLTVTDFCGDDAPALPVHGLATLLRQLPYLQSLRLDTLRFAAASQKELQELSDAFQQHDHLDDVTLVACAAADTTTKHHNRNFQEDEVDDDNVTMWERLALGLSQSTTLKQVEIVETSFPPSGLWNANALKTLCSSKSLQWLRIRGVRFLNGQDLVAISQALQDNCTLKELWILACELDFDGAGVDALAEMLQVNTTLEVLGLNRLACPTHAMVIAQALQHNQTLRRLHLCLREHDEIHDALIQDSFVTLLEHNYVLEKLTGGFIRPTMRHPHPEQQFTDISSSRDTPIDFYLRLNRHGRQQLLQNANATKEQWVEALWHQREDVSALVYLMSRNPSLFVDFHVPVITTTVGSANQR